MFFHFVVVILVTTANKYEGKEYMEQEVITYETISNRAAELLSRLAIGDEFYWKGLFGEDAWSEISAVLRPQTVGDQLTRRFSHGDHAVVEWVRVNRSPHYTVFRKISEVNAGD